MPQQDVKLIDVSVTYFFMGLHLVYAVAGIVLGFLSLVFVPFTHMYLITALSIFCTCLSMFGILKLMKFGVVYVHKRLNTGEMKRCRNQMLIGFGGISICGIVMRIIVFYFDNPYILYYCLITCLVTSLVFYYDFINEFDENWRVNYKKKHIPLISILLAIQVAVFIITMKIHFDYNDKSTGFYKYSLIELVTRHFYTLVIFASSIIDFCVVLAGGLEKKNGVRLESVMVVEVVEQSTPADPNPDVNSPRKDYKICMEECNESVIPRMLKEFLHTICENGMRLESVKIVQPSAYWNPIVIVENNSLNIDYKSCMEEYSETVIPRMLKECGHTICEKCAGKLLEKKNGQHLLCPFCQAITIVKGPVNQLQKNFAITNMNDKKMRMNGH